MKEQLPVNTGISNSIILGVDERERQCIKGRVYHAYTEGAIAVRSFDEVVWIAEKLFNDLGYPQMTTSDRDFWGTPIHIEKRKRWSGLWMIRHYLSREAILERLL